MLSRKKQEKFSVDIAGIGITFLFDRDLLELGLEGIDHAFITELGDDIELKVHHGHIPGLKKREKIFDSGTTWALCKCDGKYVLQDDSLQAGSSPDRFVVLEPDFKSGHIYIGDDASHQNLLPDPLGYPLNQVLMILLLSRGKGVLFHACGIDDRGSGYLFLGNSADGKSTMAKLWFENNATVLNDDRIVVREQDGKFWMYGTPWHGDFRELSPKGLAVNKIFFLHRGEKDQAVVKNGAEAVSMLLARSFPPLWDKKGMAYTTDLCHHIVDMIPCYVLSFQPDTRSVHFVRNM